MVGRAAMSPCGSEARVRIRDRQPAQRRDLEVNVDRYRIDLPGRRALTLSADQLRRIARGRGEQPGARAAEGRDPPIVEALRALPPTQRADALAVALLRFGDKQDVESIAQTCGLSPWEVLRLEESFRRAVAEAGPATAPRTGAGLAGELEESCTARVMSAEMLANAIAHRERLDLDQEHEASLDSVREVR